MKTIRLSVLKESCASHPPKVIANGGAIPALLLLFLTLTLCGCGHIGYKPRGFEIPPAGITSQDGNQSAVDAHPRKIVIFFDGTANDEASDTNVKRLHSLITLQNRGDIASLYILGVGTNSDPIGAAMGSGINARVMLAYEFILNHYQPKRGNVPADEIYIFGFSRGAFAARILATMLNYAGIVKEVGGSKLTGNAAQAPWPTDACTVKQVGRSDALRRFTPKELSELVHGATFPGFECGNADKPEDQPRNLKARLAINDLESIVDANNNISVPVKVLGLWDTVEALGSPGIVHNLEVPFLSAPPKTDVDEPNLRYGEKLCNVEEAYHALSIDDNRATIFTPLLLSRKHIFAGCPNGMGMLNADRKIESRRLQEVWFSGAHSDVGGGYANSGLSGVSLNWMLNRIKCKGLLPGFMCSAKDPSDKDIRFVREDFLGGSHDPTAGVWGFYPSVSRDLVTYALDKKSIWSEKSVLPKSAPLCVHESVFKRRRLIGQNDHEYDQLFLTEAIDGTNQTATVQPAPGNYGKGRSWEWPRQLKSPDTIPDLPYLEIKSYPNCSFMQTDTIIEADPIGEQR